MTTDNDASQYWRTLDPHLRENVRELRSDPTPCEVTVWNAPRGRAIEGVKFRRQHPFEQFILDFYAPELHLAIEIDGEVHSEPGRQQYDSWRQLKLEERGVQVHRFTNTEVALNLDDVLMRLRAAIYDLRNR